MSEEQKLAVWCEGEDWCPVIAAANVLGRKWHPVIIHRLSRSGRTGFNQLKQEIGSGISDKVLSDSLNDLEEKEIVDREIVSEKPVRVEYSLTEVGESLVPLIEEMLEWGKEYLKPAETPKESLT